MKEKTWRQEERWSLAPIYNSVLIYGDLSLKIAASDLAYGTLSGFYGVLQTTSNSVKVVSVVFHATGTFERVF